MKLSKIAGVLAGLSFVLSANASEGLGSSKEYNVLLLNSGTFTNSDIEGWAAIRNNGSFLNYSIGLLKQGGTALQAGSATFQNGSIYGNALISGSSSFTSMNFAAGGQLITGPSIVDFAFTANEMINLSGSLNGLSTNGSILKPFSTLNLVGTKSDLNVFNLTQANFNGTSDINIQVPNGSTVVINVKGSSFTLPQIGINYNGSQNPSAFRKVLWNFSEATSLNVNAVNGSILAPNASVSGNNGQLNGQLIANSFSGNLQFNEQSFNGNVAAVPEPATMIALGAGLAMIARKRKRA